MHIRCTYIKQVRGCITYILSFNIVGTSIVYIHVVHVWPHHDYFVHVVETNSIVIELGVSGEANLSYVTANRSTPSSSTKCV